MELLGGDRSDRDNRKFEQWPQKVFSPAPPSKLYDILFRFIRLLQDDAERRKESLEKMQASDRLTPDWLTRHVSIEQDDMFEIFFKKGDIDIWQIETRFVL